jgi:hypothetical protein
MEWWSIEITLHPSITPNEQLILGRATTEATQQFAEGWTAQGFHADGYRRLGRTGLTTSAIGFGSYRIDEQTRGHREALERALLNGCNLIDTSTNYGIGGSERCIGATLEELIDRGQIKREQVIVVTKVGYVQGDNLELAHEREQAGKPFPEMVKYQEHCWHCIHPEFIADQLTRSLERLQLECVDVYLLHNPEYFFSDAAHRQRRNVSKLRDEFYDRVRRAFAYLEEQVAAGRIAWFGVSSNSFPVSDDDPEHTSVAQMLAIAREVAGDAHHFAVIQLPMNLYESGAAFVKNNDGMTALEFAQANDLAVLVNRPLNAFYQNRLVRLADFPIVATERSLNEQLSVVKELENEFTQTVASQIQVSAGSTPPSEFFRWGEALERALPHLRDMMHWEQVRDHQIMPHVGYIVQQLDLHMTGAHAALWQPWRARYLSEFRALLRGIGNEFAQRTNAQNRHIIEHLNAHLPSTIHAESLSRKALHALTSAAGVTCVLCGMRRVAYVDDAMGVMEWERLADTSAMFLG